MAIYFLTYVTDFVLLLAMLENCVMPIVVALLHFCFTSTVNI